MMRVNAQAKDRLRGRIQKRLAKLSLTRRELARRIADHVEPTLKAAKRGARNPEWNLYVRVLRAVSAKMCPTRDVAEAIAFVLRFEPNALWDKAWGDNWKLPPWERHYGPPRTPKPEPGAKNGKPT